MEWHDDPAAVRDRALELARHVQLRCGDARKDVQQRHREDRDRDGKVANELAHNCREEQRILKVLQDDRDDVRAEEQHDRHKEDVRHVLGLVTVGTG